MTTRRLGAALALGTLLALLPGPGPGPRAAPGGDGPRLRFRASWPARGVQFVGADAVVLRFSTDVDFSTLDASSVTVGYGLRAVPGTFSPGEDGHGDPDPRVVVFTPDEPLPAGQQVRFRVSTDVASALGRPLEDPVDFTFGTSPDKGTDEVLPVPEGTRLRRAPRLGPRPRVVWTFPARGLANIYSDEVRIRFDRAMDAGSLVGGAVRILAGGLAPVAGDLAFDSVYPEEVTFTPQDPFPPATAYEMVVTRDARTRRGRALAEEFRSAFGTSPFKDGVRPLKPWDFQPGPDLAVGRAFHAAVALASGRVLLAGGEVSAGVATPSAELFVPALAAFQRVGDMAEARRKFAAVELPGGKVLACGGFGSGGATLATAEIFDPATGLWTGAAPMAVPRANHTATVLANGTVLVAGGFTGTAGSLRYEGSGEIYNPTGDTWTSAGPLAVARGGHTASTLPDGRVLLAGGESTLSPAAEVWDPSGRVFRRTLGDPSYRRMFHAAAPVRLGAVLLAGGGPPTAERFDPYTETFSDAGNCPPYGLPVSDSPVYATLTPIPGTRVMLLGGLASNAFGPGTDAVLAQVQLWDARSGGGYGAFFPMTFTVDPPRAAHTVTPLLDGRYLVAGGVGGSSPSSEKRSTLLTPSE